MGVPNFGGGMPRQGILSLAIGTRAPSTTPTCPYVKGGGLFVPTAKKYNLGDEVFILLTLMDEKDRLPVAGKVVWITPAGARATARPVSACSSTTPPTARLRAPRSSRYSPASSARIGPRITM